MVAIAGALALYPRGPTSNTVYCGILQYVIFPAQGVTHSSTFNTTQTMTTVVDFTTTTTPGIIGRTYSNSTTSTNGQGYSAGVETICKYISVTTTVTASSSSKG
ncbi:MAG TPA: hypothetical protein VLX56_02785 [Nitrososphaerales archaeon]|nr:hypothetical protein [Nitrososphaerales archaeon]